jgi:acetate kinase
VERIAVINAGSSSIKFAVFNDGPAQEMIFRGQVEGIGTAPRLRVADGEGEVLLTKEWAPGDLDHQKATRTILETSMALLGGERVSAIGHRVVHGGTQFSAPVIVDSDVVAALRILCPLAPLHQPHNLAPIEVIAKEAPQIVQVACFDTAFHQSQPPVAQMFALPRDLSAAGIRRYGFHGLSYEYVGSALREVAPDLATGRVIVAHLGNGASLCAMHDGRSCATTMGFTAVDGLMMGTRCGALDPGVLIYLMDEKGLDARGLEELIYKKSGLLGVSGISSDMRTLKQAGTREAADAVDLFVYRIVREIGSLVAALGGLDGIVFTGGIGENDSDIRGMIAGGCEWLGLSLDPDLNQSGQGRIHRADSRLAAWVIRTDEERMIARLTSTRLGRALGENRMPAPAASRG